MLDSSKKELKRFSHSILLTLLGREGANALALVARRAIRQEKVANLVIVVGRA